MAVRFVFHVGPHKTGTTSAQETLHANRDRLIRGGVFYPPSLPGAEHPTSHAALTGLLAKGRSAEFWEWLVEAGRQAGQSGCDTVFVSSEGFAGGRVWRPFAAIVRRIRRGMRRECRILYVQRDLPAVTYSMMVQRLYNQTGFLHGVNHDLRAWARQFAEQKQREERFFDRLGAAVLHLETTPRPELTSRLLALATDRPFPDIVTGVSNLSAEKFGGPPQALLSYPLRIMELVAHGGTMASPTTHRAAAALISSVRLDEEAFAALVRDFEVAARREIALGIEDHARETWSSRLRDRLRRAFGILVPGLP